MSIFRRIPERSSILKKNNNSNDTLISLGNERIYFQPCVAKSFQLLTCEMIVKESSWQ